MKKKSVIHSVKHLILFLMILLVLSISIIAIAALSLSPEIRGEGNESETIVPSISGAGDGTEILIPEAVDGNDGNTETYEPFVPEFDIDEPFVDVEESYDFSEQYDYSYAGMSPANGNCEELGGVYTATTSTSMYIHRSSYAPFPYGTISADVMNNGGDSGIVFGLSSNYDTFWEGEGISYYFAFVSFEGVLFLGRTDNGVWSTLAYTSISKFDASATYNVKVLYRIDRMIIFLNDVPMLSYRTTAPLEGTGWGIRTGATGAQISNISVSSKVTVE